MSDGFYDDWIASDDTSDHYDPIQAHLEGQLEELERKREHQGYYVDFGTIHISKENHDKWFGDGAPAWESKYGLKNPLIKSIVDQLEIDTVELADPDDE